MRDYELDFDEENEPEPEASEVDDYLTKKNEIVTSPQSVSNYTPFQAIKEVSEQIEKRKDSAISVDETDGSKSAVEKYNDAEIQHIPRKNSDSSSWDDDDENYEWFLKFHTIDRPTKSGRRPDETLSFQIVGVEGETKPLSIENHDALYFMPRQVDSFKIKTKKIGRPKYVILSLTSPTSTPKWHLDKVCACVSNHSLELT
jgi:hypothetical protein